MRDLTIAEKIVMSKSLSIGKVVHLALTKNVPIFTVEQLNIIKNKTLQDSTLCNSYENCGLKDVDIL